MRSLIAELSSVLCGDFSRLDVKSIGDYVSSLEDSVSYLEEQACSPFLPLREKNAQLAAQGRAALARVQLQRREKIIRRQPFGFIISGPPGCGKSFAAMRLATDLYRSIHGKWSSDELIVLNEGDDFQSEFRTTHKIVVFDDLGATRVSVVSHDPFRKVIDFINNVPRTALNPHLDLKGNVWINPEIVVATTNMFVPFRRNSHLNTDSILCLDAINRRFPLMIIQEGYDRFHLKDPLAPAPHEEFATTFLNKALSYDEVLETALKMYREHFGAQEEFVAMVEDRLQMESAAGSMLTFSMIVALQTIVRFYVSKLAFTQHVPEASFLSALRRFTALDLQSLKTAAKQEVVSYLRVHANFSGPEIVSWIHELQKNANLSATAIAISLHARNITSFVEAIEVAIPIASNYVLRRARYAALPNYYASIVYDIATVAIPALLGKYWENVVEEINTQDPGFGKNQPIDNKSDFKKLSNYYNHKIANYRSKISRCQENVYFYVSSWLRRPKLVPEGRKHAKSYPSRLVESGKFIKCKVTRERQGPFIPNNNGLASQVYASLAAYKSQDITLKNLFRDIGSMQTGNFEILFGMNITHDYFTFGPYFLAYREKGNVLYIMRTVNLKLKFNLNEMYSFMNSINTVSSSRIVFVGRAGSRLVISPLFGRGYPETLQEDLDDILSNDFMAKSFINLNGRKPTTINAHLCAIQVGNLNRISEDKKSEIIPPPAPG